ncbi:MAG: hypothetical protein ACFFCQ_12965, partial [Promethearchaeota archaeon]
MDIIEVEIPLEHQYGKKIHVVVIETESLVNSPISLKKIVKTSINSAQYLRTIEKLIERINPDLIAEEIDFSSKDIETNEVELIKLFKRKKIPFFDIKLSGLTLKSHSMDGFILDWLWDVEDEIKEELKEYASYEHFMNLYSWYYCHKGENPKLKNEITALIDETGFIMGILDNVRLLTKNYATIFIITTPSHFMSLKDFFNKLSIEYEERSLNFESEIVIDSSHVTDYKTG